MLWPGGTFFTRVGTQTVINAMDEKTSQMSESGGSKIYKSGSGSFEEQLEAARRASDVKKLLFG